MSRLKLLVRATNNISNCNKIAGSSLVSVRHYAVNLPEDTETHTGQKWACDDYRMARFIDKPKHVNENFAIKLVAGIPPKACKDRVVWCDGGSGPEGHPKVYINLDKPGNHSCGYCGLRFYLDAHH